MEVISIGIIFIFLITACVIWRSKRKSQEENIDTYISTTSVPTPPIVQGNDRWFTLSELKQSEDGRYSWDETGCVFEINTDGSVTIVGRFDPAELLVDPIQEMFEQLSNDGLIDMLPRMWSFCAVNNGGGENDTFAVALNGEILSVPACPHTIEEVKELSLLPSSIDLETFIFRYLISTIAKGYLILMPSNEKEYILSLGAKACIERALGDTVRVKISCPAAMGAFGIALLRSAANQLKISFAFGDGEDYMCCNLLADNGVYEVQKLLHESIILPLETVAAIQHIAKGCMVQSLILERRVANYTLIDMLPYTMSFLQKVNGRVIKIYDCISEPISIPTRQGDKDINIDANKTLSFLIGSNELIEDVMAECNAPYGKNGVFIEIDSDMNATIKVTSNNADYRINIGELIG